MAASTAIIGRVAVKVSPDTSDFRRDAERKLDALEKTPKVTIPTRVDITGAKRDLLEGIRAINAENKASARKIRVHAAVSRESLREVAGEVDDMRRRVSPVKVETKVDTDGLRKFLRLLGNIGTSAAKFAALASAVGGIAALTLSAASNLAALSASLATLAPAALALPGLLVGIGLGLAATVVAFKDFGKVFPDVKAKLGELRAAISDNFWDRAKAPVREFVDVLLPQFAAGMSGIATNLGNLFGDLATSLKGSLDGAIAPMFARLGESIEIARGATDGLAGIIATLGQVGADYLPRLSQWFVDLTNRFNVFLSGAAADGRLRGWIDTGLQGFRDLGAVIGGLGGILYGIGTAAVEAGGSVLGTLGAALQRVSDIVNSPAFQAGLVGVFRSAHEALDRIATLSGPGVSALFSSLANLLPTLLPLIGEGLGTALGAVATALAQVEVQRAVVAMFDAFLAVVQALAPVLPPLVAVLGTALTGAFTAVGTAVRAVSGFLTAHTTTAKVLAGVLTAVVVPALAGWGIATTLNAAKSVAAWLSVSVAALKATATVVAQVTVQIGKWALLAAQATLNAAKVVASWALTAATAVAAAVVHVAQVGVMVAKWVLLGTQALIAGAKVAAAWLLALGPIGIIIAAVIAAVALIVANWDTVVGATKKAWDRVKGATSAAWGAIKGGVGAAVEFIVALFTNFTVPGLVIKHWETIKGAFSSGVEAVMGFLRGLPGQIAGVFSNAGSILTGAGRAIIDGLLSGITGAFGKVKAKLGELTSMLPDWKGPAPRDRLLLVDAGQLIIGGLITGMESQYGAVRRSLQGLTADIGSTLIDAPKMGDIATPARGASATLADRVAASVADGPVVVQNKTLVYNAAPGSSLGAEEDLFAAVDRSRMVGW